MATLKSKALKKSLSEKAEQNARVTKGTSKDQKVVKEGVPIEHSNKHLHNSKLVGVNIGTTLNMGDYESLRVDVWLTDDVSSKETYEEAYERVISVAHSTLEKVVNLYRD